MRWIVVVLLFQVAMQCKLNAQALIPIKFTSEDDNLLLKENDSLRYYTATGDSVNIVAINEEALYYKLVNKRNKAKTVAEGGIVADGDSYLQHGHWVQYYTNGVAEIKGNYMRGKPVGEWETYYKDGKVKTTVHYALITDKDGTNTCISGVYKEYFANGRLKTLGYYTADRNRYQDTLQVEDPISGSKQVKTLYKSVYTPRKIGEWEYYTTEGELEKKEEL
jgi:antitoxin component YwqK of YwqJK toxin-antitoxin module